MLKLEDFTEFLAMPDVLWVKSLHRSGEVEPHAPEPLGIHLADLGDLHAWSTPELAAWPRPTCLARPSQAKSVLLPTNPTMLETKQADG